MIDFEQLKGKTIAITGASRGIGRETAGLLSQLGANLVLGARNEEDLKSVTDQMNSRTLVLPLDVSDETSVNTFTKEAVSHFKRIDALINCAGVGTFDSLLSLSIEDFNRMISVNLKGTFLCCQSFGRHMNQNRQGKIINLVSIAGTMALPGCGGYSASKFGVLGLTRVLQAELRDKGIQVTAVLPGAVDTSFWDKMEQKPDLSQMIPAQTIAKHLVYILCQPSGAVVDEVTIMPPLGIL
ncbi:MULTISPECIES: SDR family oxidoreductase [unclassified Paenibacillus]|uniref:SDR family oxidoreductase n=1 Tax=unclassified Paenibacillus TaxID=185978 RepID=UPI001AEB767A|nr:MULTISPECIES: SDR family oxidoreductase [unclassified Paenibacillus]MBP1153975.1 3-oxoacyl-[acyl-carrier protein] reductase [Paenibacillus sp. PvP091]MBP1170640.1 3-oxoacyl-[acyl-carrier protein] reductase [Paenibacillus sp. PvR098]MBP2441668.1 3-oxoacyl-[acyl-carrier protein] reductase [Paenibacillus sp. PvP052]